MNPQQQILNHLKAPLKNACFGATTSGAEMMDTLHERWLTRYLEDVPIHARLVEDKKKDPTAGIIAFAST